MSCCCTTNNVGNKAQVQGEQTPDQSLVAIVLIAKDLWIGSFGLPQLANALDVDHCSKTLSMCVDIKTFTVDETLP